MKKLMLLVIVLLLVSVAAAQPAVDGVIAAEEYANSVAHDTSGATISWSVVEETLFIGLAVEHDGWVGLGFLLEEIDQKLGADQYMFTISDGQELAMDMTQTKDEDEPELDEDEGGSNSILEHAQTVDGESQTIEFSRLLDTGEATDVVITPGQPLLLMLALGKDTDPSEEHRKKKRWILEDFIF